MAETDRALGRQIVDTLERLNSPPNATPREVRAASRSRDPTNVASGRPSSTVKGAKETLPVAFECFVGEGGEVAEERTQVEAWRSAEGGYSRNMIGLSSGSSSGGFASLAFIRSRIRL
jgi:hypothetical protein